MYPEMQPPFDRDRLRKFLSEIASTGDEEIDCEALDRVLEQVVAIGANGEDIRAILPDVAVHMEHCPECAEWYQMLALLAAES